MLAQAGAHFNPTSSRSWSWIRRCRRRRSWPFFLLANVAVRQSVSLSVHRAVNHNPFRLPSRTNQTRYRSAKIYGSNKIYSAQPEPKPQPQSQPESEPEPEPTLPLGGREQGEILSSSTCLAIKMLHASSAWRAGAVHPAESRRDFNCSVRPQMSFTFELRQSFLWVILDGRGRGQGRQLASCHAHRHLSASTSVHVALA